MPTQNFAPPSRRSLCVSVLVDYAWALLPSSSTAAAKDQVGAGDASRPETRGTQGTSNRKASERLIPDIRVSVPSSIAAFVRAFNSAKTSHVRHLYEQKALDILARLENLVLASTIHDPLRGSTTDAAAVTAVGANSATLLAQRQVAAAATLNSSSSRARADNPPSDSEDVVASKTRRYAAQARRSLLALSRVRSRSVREESYALLLEALDTNVLGSDDGEVASLLLLVSEMADVMEVSLFARNQRNASKKRLIPSSEESNAGGEATSVVQEDGSPPPPIIIDEHMERLVLCISLAIQRLEYACEVKAFYIPQEVHGAFERMMSLYLPALSTDDPFLVQLISSTEETIKWLISAKVEAEELMASPVALSLLSQITRMSPPANIPEMLDPFFGILTDLKEKGEWHLGRKFVKLLGVAASLNIDACKLFISLLHRMTGSSWTWQYHGLLCLGIISLSSTYSAIRKLALEDGLLVFINAEPGAAVVPNSAEDHSWKLRSASVLALSEIYQRRRSDPLALLAYEAMRQRKLVETNELVLSTLSKTTSAQNAPRRLFHLYKYICTAMAETYSESQSRYMFLRKYLRTTDRKQVITHRRPYHRPQSRNAARQRLDGHSSSKFFWSEGESGSRRGGSPVQPSQSFLFDEDGQDAAAANTVLSDMPYHQNYKNVEGGMGDADDHEDMEPVEHDISSKKHLPTEKDGHETDGTALGPSLLAAHPYTRTSVHEVVATQLPINGSSNRRKLFNRGKTTTGRATEKKSVKLPQGVPIVLPKLHVTAGDAQM